MPKNRFGEKYSKLTIIDNFEVKTSEKVTVRCDCGNVCKKLLKDVLSGKTKSCGCSAHPLGKDYFGKKFGMLKVIDHKVATFRKKVMCVCECGIKKEISVKSLVEGTTISCGRCGKRKDLRGMTFGKLKILGFDKIDEKHHAVWKCKCECGKEISVMSSYLISGKKTMCDECKNLELPKLNLIGQKYGKLLVVEYAGKGKYGSLWKCKCDCGNYYIARSGDIRHGNTSSCGCVPKQKPKDISGKMIGYLEPIQLAEYEIGTGVRWECLCHRCGRTKIISASDLNSDRIISCGCASSSGEEKIKEILDTFSMKFVAQKRFSDCKDKKPLPFDVYISDKNICIEYDGIGHYEPIKHFGGKKRFEERKRHDSIKTKYCEDNNIKLIRIPYFEFENIEKILREQNAIK